MGPADRIVEVVSTLDSLGECPTWNVQDGSFYWIDVRGPSIHRLDPEDRVRTWTMPEMIGCLAPLEPGRVLVALRGTVSAFDLDTEDLEVLARPPEGVSSMRFNDGRCDRQGRFWVGSMDDVGRGPVGHLYRLDQSGFARVLDGVAIPNSLCWSPDGTVMYFADGIEPVIWAFSFDPETGTPSARREFARLAPGTGIPDGATVDEEGFLWSAQYGGGVLTRYAPDGTIDRILPVPVSQPTSCAFGGPDLKTLFITTARQRLSPDELAAQPLAGALLAFEPGVRGLPEPGYRP